MESVGTVELSQHDDVLSQSIHFDEEVDDEECAARLASLLEPADVVPQLTDPDEV